MKEEELISISLVKKDKYPLYIGYRYDVSFYLFFIFLFLLNFIFLGKIWNLIFINIIIIKLNF